MQLKNRKFFRSILLGLSFCIFLFLLFQVLKWRRVKEIDVQWEEKRGEWNLHAGATAEQEFEKLTQEVLARASRSAQDLKKLQQENPQSQLLSFFSRILQDKNAGNYTFELADSTGTIQVWSGKSVRIHYPGFSFSAAPDSILLLTEVRHHIYLTVGLPVATGSSYLYVSKAIESHDPLNPQNVQRGFSLRCSQELDRQVELIVPDSTGQKIQMGDSLFALKDFYHGTIGYVNIQPQKKETAVAAAQLLFDQWNVLLCALMILLLGILLTLYCKSIKLPWLSLALSIAVLWGIRFGWILVDFPRSIVGGMLFDPSLYASSFGFGLSSTLGDLLLSAVVLLCSAIWIFREYLRRESMIKSKPEEHSLRGILGAAAAILMPFLLLALLRAYGAALRSFFFDSTIRLSNPIDIIPDLPAAMLQFVILCLSTAVVALACMLIDISRRFWQSKNISLHLNPWIVVLIHYAFCAAVFYSFDENPQVPLYSLGILLLSAYTLYDRVIGRFRFRVISPLTSALICIMICTYFLAVPSIRMHSIEREKKNVELIASEVARPADEWISYLIQEGLRSASRGIQEKETLSDVQKAKEENLAFRLWMQMPLSRRGYNSAVVLYDLAGAEIDRFAVGLSSYEQREILSKVFQGEEETVGNVQPSLSMNVPKLYGSWAAIRNGQGSVLGSMAVVMSAGREVQLGYEETGLLTVPSSTYGELTYRNYAISEYRNGVLASTTAQDFSVPAVLPPDVSANLDSTLQYYWQRQTLQNREFHTLYTRDQREPERIVAVHLAPLDIRLSLFNYVKTGFILFFFVLCVFTAGVLTHRRWKMLIFSFRFRLFIGFTIISMIPLIFLGYYNRKFASEISDQGTSELLQREISTLERRFAAYVENENDFVNGVNDDFCEALSSEYGIDLSVYYGSRLQASSRSELYRAGLLDPRLDGDVFRETAGMPNKMIFGTERIGLMTYTVVSKALKIGNKVVGVISVPTLSRQHILDMEISQRNAFIFGTYLLAFGMMIAATAFLAHRMTRPLLELNSATRKVGKGDLSVSVASNSRDELGDLIRSFNDMTKELEENRKDLSKAEREHAWREMAKQVAHEIRNPITPMKLSIQHLQQLFKDKAPQREETLQAVMKSMMEQIDTLSRIATEFSTFAKMPEAQYVRFDLKEVVSETIVLFAQVKEIRFVVKVPDRPMFLVADKDQIQRVFINIFRNAVQAMGRGGIIDTVLTELPKSYSVGIHDTGPGIAPELLQKIFEPNFSTKTEGMGLGLAIVRKIVEDYGGTIRCESVVGKGTSFEINLPH
jgi:signal transduction histidine kinase